MRESAAAEPLDLTDREITILRSLLRDWEKSQLPDPLLLSPREKQVLILQGSGFSGEEIAERLNISLTTVRTHSAAILSKFAVANSRAAVCLALKRKIISVSDLV